ncbi:hypothetical protein F5887DRAFT_674717 [Amanita rubescens]|nr:hypothetical protein F5887DRAFT_674717 [Amanita rubescens]
MPTLRLKCLIEGEFIVFPVTAVCDDKVSDLEKSIQSERALDSLKDVGPHTLELWKVNIDLNTHDKQSRMGHKTWESWGIEELEAWRSISHYWSVQPHGEHLHIIVKASGL